jgi:hypothetical protein
MKLSIIILNYKTADLTISCVKSLEKEYSLGLKNKNFEIIIVDNSSGDGSYDKLKLHAKNKDYLRVFEADSNLGFAKGCNFGAKKATGEYLFFLNSDTQVLDAGLLKMLGFLEKNPKVCVLGAQLRNSDNTPQASAGAFYNIPNLIIMLLGGQRLGFLKTSPKKIKKVDWVSGAALMISKKVFVC